LAGDQGTARNRHLQTEAGETGSDPETGRRCASGAYQHLRLQRVRGLPPDEIARIHRNVSLIALAIPAISVFGVVFAGAMKARDNRRLLRQGYGREEVQRMVAEPEERPAPNWWILGGSLLFVVFTLTVGLNPLPYNEEIVFAGSMAIVVFLIDGSRASLSPTRARRSSVPRS